MAKKKGAALLLLGAPKGIGDDEEESDTEEMGESYDEEESPELDEAIGDVVDALLGGDREGAVAALKTAIEACKMRG